MNPDGTNPSTNTGAGAAADSGAGAVVPPALDFTSSDSATTTNLSMADSLASAADNLTSAGMAAKEPDNGSIGLGQIGASDPSATMERPDEPLVPAAPVPGSLGSVTSGPALGATSMTGAGTGLGSTSGTAGTSATGFGASSASSNPGASSVLGGSSALGGGSSASSAAGTSGAAGASSMSSAPSASGVSSATVNEPYNPFAAHGNSTGASSPFGRNSATMGAKAAGQTSSSNVPVGSQPATEKFSGKLASAKKPSMVTVILGILAVVSLVMAIVFAVLWQQALANQKVTYVPPADDGGNVNQTMAMITCTKNLGTDEAEVLAGLADHNLAATAKFSDDQLESVTMLNKYTFVDAAAAEATRSYFDGAVVWYGSVAGEAGVSAEPATLDITETMVTLGISATPAQLVGGYAEVFGLTAGEDGKVGTSREEIQANYAANGFACTEG